MLWSDPEETEGFTISPRGAGYIFGPDAVQQFNRNNRRELVARSHQLVMEGFKLMFDNSLVTVWSAPIPATARATSPRFWRSTMS
jgi:serine/threonine-protein phosphatase 4 catalytic subunit